MSMLCSEGVLYVQYRRLGASLCSHSVLSAVEYNTWKPSLISLRNPLIPMDNLNKNKCPNNFSKN